MQPLHEPTTQLIANIYKNTVLVAYKEYKNTQDGTEGWINPTRLVSVQLLLNML